MGMAAMLGSRALGLTAMLSSRPKSLRCGSGCKAVS